MAIKASASITLSAVVDIENTCYYYCLQSSSSSAPSAPTSNPPPADGVWKSIEPSYSETDGDTKTLYFVTMTTYSDGTWDCSDVNVSSSYEAAKKAYNKANAAESTANSALDILGSVTITDSENNKTYVKGSMIETGSVTATQIDVYDLFAQDITAKGTITGAKLIGAELSGEAIDIQADVAKDSDGAYSTFRLYTDSENDSPTFHIRVKHVQSSYHSDMTQNATDISLSAAVVTLDGDFIEIGADNSDVTLKGTVNMNADVYINDMRPYITAGDTVKISTAYCAGGVTGSTKTLYFYIPMARPIVDVSSVTISNASSAQITARKPAGGYIVQNAAPSSLGTITCKAYENGVTVSIKASSAYDATNNAPTTVSVENLQLKFT